MTSNEIRQKFLDFFIKKNHKLIKSSSLVPHNDDTLLFVNAGMVQFKDVFLGQDKREYSRATSVQRCVRAGGKHNDLENVGFTARHHTFFEMLGNFSFGDYFKEDAIVFAWEFLTIILKIPANKLWITVYEDDLEAETIWLDKIGISKNRFSRCGKKDNFWSMGDVGPCGPCSEIFYDHGQLISGGPPGSPDEDGDRYIEIWNLVFMQYNRDSGGNLTPLPKPSVDTGMGLERLVAILQNVHSNYDIDLFQSLMRFIAKTLSVDNHNQTSIRVIADHIRSCAFMIVDGIVPGNEGRSYVLRRIIRRAVRHGHKLGCKSLFFYKIVPMLVEQMGKAYPELANQQTTVAKILKKEELRFAQTLDSGLKILYDYLKTLKNNTISGEMVFKLYDTFGFPVDLTFDIAREKNLKLDMETYKKLMQQQQIMARSTNAFKSTSLVNIDVKSKFIGYETLCCNANILKIIIDDTEQSTITASQNAILVLDKTPFYAESGGQVADIGILSTDNIEFIVSDVQKTADAILHFGMLKKGIINQGDQVSAMVNIENRNKIAKNHSATHLLHAALRQILGKNVQQKGSLVNSKYLRFDFSFDESIGTEKLQKIENLINSQIQNQIPVVTKIMNLEQAKELGAMALFNEKYTNDVRVLTIGNFSIELCGGTHAENTNDIGLIKIISEVGIASGIRRIEAITSNTAFDLLNQSYQITNTINQTLNIKSKQILNKIQMMLAENKQLTKELADLKYTIAKTENADLFQRAIEVNNIKILVATLNNLDIKSLRSTMDDTSSKLNNSVILFASVFDNKIILACKVSKQLTNTIKAGDIMKIISAKISGKGGGRPDMAQGGGNDIDALPVAMQQIQQWIIENIKT